MCFRETQGTLTHSVKKAKRGIIFVMADHKKKIDIEQVSKYLQRAFANAQQRAVQKIGHDNSVGTRLYQYQTDFVYLLDEIQRGPRYIVSMKITEANKLIEQLENEAM